ncbi:hypothetical protein TAMA11512_23800 [Selenomonas sp. TAMA-11512]|uniref:SEC-C metal-binding domain-containing protein n=1 Tax=Selenomonas sp. TAMA-11512 TaxID=3095337 RepID=UPI0030877C57|nr:hypothetical protein TAMA11512_23800 [Selenomonas sp. TAMA-11512]
MKSEDENQNYISIPEMFSRRKLNAMYRAIPLKDRSMRLLRKYFTAMANLYGIISLRDAKSLLDRLHPRLVTEEEFLAFSVVARHEIEDYTVMGHDEIYINVLPVETLDREIIHTLYFYDEDYSYHETAEHQAGKPLYIPKSKEELLAYSDSSYFEPTEEMKAFSELFDAHLPSDWSVYVRKGALEDIFEQVRFGVNSSDLLHKMMDNGVCLDDLNDVKELLQCFTQYSNNARIHANRGFTPSELMEQAPAEYHESADVSFSDRVREAIATGAVNIEDLREQIATMEVTHERIRQKFLTELDTMEKEFSERRPIEKIGRNEPCPCGSGKKYKKCCGR